MTSYDVDVGGSVVKQIADAVDACIRITDAWSGAVVVDGRCSTSFERALAAAGSSGDPAVGMVREAIDTVERATGLDPRIACMLVCSAVKTGISLRAAGVSMRDVGGVYASLRRAAGKLNGRRASRDDVAAAGATSIVMDALDMSGLDGRIFFEEYEGTRTHVTLRTGHCFESVRPSPAAVGAGWTAYDVRVACIDGVCESVSELDSLLTGANETGEPLVLFARKFDDDVVNTIVVNNRRRTLNVLPVVVPYDLMGANVLKDIAVVVGGDVVTMFDGRCLGSLDIRSLPTVERCHASHTTLTIERPHHTGDIASHIDALHESLGGHIDEVIVGRMRALCSRTVSVRVPKGAPHGPDVDRRLRFVRSAVASGVVDACGIENALNNAECGDAARSIASVLTQHTSTVIPVACVKAALETTAAQGWLLASVGALLKPVA